MRARVFVSCGQRTDEEREATEKISNLLTEMDFEPFVATQQQAFDSLKEKILDELRAADL